MPASLIGGRLARCNPLVPTFYVTFAADKNEPYVPLEQMAKVIADTPLEAAKFALAKASGPVIG